MRSISFTSVTCRVRNEAFMSTSPCRNRMRSENSSMWRISAIEISRMIFERYW